MATYPIALVNGGSRVEAGDGFIALVLSPAGQRVLQGWVSSQSDRWPMPP